MTEQEEQAIHDFLRWLAEERGVVLASYYEERGLSALQGTDLETLIEEYREHTRPAEPRYQPCACKSGFVYGRCCLVCEGTGRVKVNA